MIVAVTSGCGSPTARHACSSPRPSTSKGPEQGGLTYRMLGNPFGVPPRTTDPRGVEDEPRLLDRGRPR